VALVQLIAAPPFEALFDFGVSTSPLEPGYTQVLKNSTYSAAAGFGWLEGSVDSRDRGASAGNALERDFNFTKFATFAVDVPFPGEYEITLTLGDGGGYLRDQMGIIVEGLQLDSVTSTGIVVRTYTVMVTDGQLTLLLDDLGGDPNVMINGLEVREVVQASGMQTAGSSSDGDSSASGLNPTGGHFVGSQQQSLPLAALANAWKESSLFARPLGSSDKAKVTPLVSQGQTPRFDDHPVLDQVFSANLPAILDQLDQLGKVALDPSI
jgi:hypothetical protein